MNSRDRVSLFDARLNPTRVKRVFPAHHHQANPLTTGTMTPEQCLPNALLIILHLHLLNYPLQDAAGYDERLFEQSRGMRERTKAMEDITYFLVTRVEGSKERAKAVSCCLSPRHIHRLIEG